MNNPKMAEKITFKVIWGPTDRPTDRPTDEVSYRGASSQLRTMGGGKNYDRKKYYGRRKIS
jgi:hypothetical protein